MMTIPARLFPSLFTLAAALSASLAHAASPYAFFPIGGLGDSTYAADINNAGQIAGTASYVAADGSLLMQRAFRYSSGVVQELGTLAHQSGKALAINNAGDVLGAVGTAYSGNASMTIESFVMDSAGQMTAVGDANPYVQAFNDQKQILTVAGFGGINVCPGVSNTMGCVSAPYGSFSGIRTANDINNFGLVAGTSTSNPDSQGNWPATQLFIYDSAHGSAYSTPLPHSVSFVGAVSDSALVVGADANSQAFIYSVTTGSTQTLGPLSAEYDRTFATGVNNAGQVVGFALNAAGARRAFLYSNGVMSDLNSIVEGAGTDWVITDAPAINDAGLIAANATINGRPIAILINPVPEPGTSALVLLGLMAAAGAARRRA